MPNIVPSARYYPKLSEIVVIEDLPEFLSFVQDGLDAIFDKIHYKNLQYSKSARGDSAFYSLEIVSKKIAFELPFDMALVLNSDLTGEESNLSSFPITLEYQWEILAFLKSFDLNNFSFSLEEFYDVGLKVFRLSEDEVLAHIINYFVQSDESTTKFEQFVDDFNVYKSVAYPSIPNLVLPSDPSVNSLVQAVNALGIPDKTISLQLFGIYILDTDINVTKYKLQQFFNIIVPEGIEAYIKKLIIPRAKASLGLNAAIEFPLTILRPIDDQGNLMQGKKSRFLFAEADLFVDTQEGISYQFEMGGQLYPNTAEIGKTGILITIDSLKLDLSRTENIAEADADGRPADFRGVYARAMAVTLPARWFHNDAVQGSASTGLRLGAYDFLIGTGGLSGTILLESVPVNYTAPDPYYYHDKFEIQFPITLFKKNSQNNKVEEVSVIDLPDLKQKLFPNDPNIPIPNYTFKFPLTVKELPLTSNVIKTFANAAQYQTYLTSFPTDNDLGPVPTLWKRVGGTPEKPGFRVGFNKFDITFKQNVIVESNIEGRLQIPKLKDADGNISEIIIKGHVQEDGDFNLTASEPQGISCNLFDALTVTFQSLALGKESGTFYIEADTKLSFPDGSFANSIFQGKEVDLPALRFYFDGRFEIAGGNAFIPVNLTLPLGPIEMSVTGIHLGSIQREHQGKMRKYNYVGFDGGMSIDPIGLDVRGNGVKYYYTIDDDEAEGNDSDYYLHISTLELDLIIPGHADPKSAIAIIKGSLTIPEPGVSTEYRGKISIQLPKAKISASADIRLDPTYPAYLIDAAVDLPAPIPLGPIGIYSFKGLIGQRYVAEKRAIGMVEEDSWYDYYVAPQKGINVLKFTGPQQTKDYTNPFSVGVGAAMATMGDGGRIASLRAMMFLSVPSMFAIDAGFTILAERLKLAEFDNTTPPFWAFVIIGDDSLEFGAGAKYKLNKSKGWFLDIQSQLEVGFFFKNQKPWYVNFGKPSVPITAKLFKEVLNVNCYAYLMIAAKGIEAGARADFKFNFIIAKFTASVEVGAFISFERPQVGAYALLKGGIKIKFGPFKLSAQIKVYLAVEMPKPFLIYAEFIIKVCAKFAFVRVCIPVKFTLKWKKNNTMLYAPIPALTYQDDTSNVDYIKLKQHLNFVKGVNMLTSEEFDLQYFGVNTAVPNPELIECIIPLDTYIDIKVEKGLDPTPLHPYKIGGHTGGASNFVDLIPPKRQLKGGKTIRQVKHKYSILSLQIFAWAEEHLQDPENPESPMIPAAWVEYHPFKALLPDNPNVDNLKIGFWQKNSKQYDTIRLLATNPFSFLDGAEPGWFIPEQYGITPSSLFCTSTEEEWDCANVLEKLLGTTYHGSIDPNFMHYIDGAYFIAAGPHETTVDALTGEIVSDPFANLTVLQVANPFNFEQSLVFRNSETLEIKLPESSVNIKLKITTNSQGATIKYYRTAINDASIFQAYELIESVYKTAAELTTEVVFDNYTNYDPLRNVFKIEIIPDFPNLELIHDIEAQIEDLLLINQEAGEGSTASVLSGSALALYNQLVIQLNHLKTIGCNDSAAGHCDKDELLCGLYDYLQNLLETCFLPLSVNSVYDYCNELECFEDFIKKVQTFDTDNPNYGLIQNHLFDLFNDYSIQIDILRDWCQNHDPNLQMVFDYYTLFVNTATNITNVIGEVGHCNCDEEGGPCDKDELLCDLYSLLLGLYNDCFISLPDKEEYLYCQELGCFTSFLNHIKDFNTLHPEYLLVSTHILNQYETFEDQLNQLTLWCSNQNPDAGEVRDYYNSFVSNAFTIITIIGNLGDCNCGEGNILNCTTSFHQICWKTLSHFEYTQTVPSQPTVQEDTDAMIAGINTTAQPIWRPNTKYYIKFTLKDNVDDGQRPSDPFNYYYGFKTVGPIGHFHKYPGAYPIPETIIVDGVEIKQSIDEFPLTSLKKYIDYNRSYPNADGNLILAKPLFYGQDQCKIDIYFAKTFAYHMFKTWESYNGLKQLKGSMHLAIKDPISNLIIPYPLPQDWEVDEFVPETILNGDNGWVSDQDPRMPLNIQILNQFINSVNLNPGSIHCSIDLGDPIQPASYTYSVTLANLKPRKLYTALVYNAFDQNEDGLIENQIENNEVTYEESQKVHEYTFQTSRYENFKQQVESVTLKEIDDLGNVLNEKQAVYEIVISLTTDQIDNAFALVSGINTAETLEMESQFYHPFDRVIEGVFGMKPHDPPTTTDFISIKNSETDKVVALIIRNPEPFNNPRIPLEEVLDTVFVHSKLSLDPNQSYKFLYSKDYSQIIMMHINKEIVSQSLRIMFKYKIWNGSQYIVPDETLIPDDEKIYSIKTYIQIKQN